MHEQLIFIPKKPSMGKKILNMVWFILACLSILGATFITPIIFSIPAVGFTLLWLFQQFRSNIEYEYTYLDGDLKFARIKNKAKRKRIATIHMDDVIMIAPKGDRSVYKYENDNAVTHKDLTSGDANAKVYEVIHKSENSITRYEFEPDEEMLDAMLVKYPRIVVK